MNTARDNDPLDRATLWVNMAGTAIVIVLVFAFIIYTAPAFARLRAQRQPPDIRIQFEH